MLPRVAQHLEVLPHHPKPEPFESSSSFLTRLCEINGLSLLTLSRLIFTDCNCYLTSSFADYPLAYYGNLPRLILSTEYQLLMTSFYPLCRRLGVTNYSTVAIRCQ